MTKRILYIFICFFIISITCDAQNYRLQSMGDLFIVIEDQDNDLNLYDFGGNPAGIVFDEVKNGVFIDLDFKNINGDYRRIYEPGILDLYELKFIRFQNLGKSGIFRGFATYTVENRKNLYRSLILNPYDGKAFFVTDTTTGNFKYTGPGVRFDYGLEITKNLSSGIRLTYSLLDGLKDIYTRTRTIYRNITGNLGLAVKIFKTFNLGLTFGVYNAQEKLEAKSEDLYDAEVYLSRGDIYSIKRRSNVVNLKLMESGYSTGFQIVYGNTLKNAVAFRLTYNQLGQFLLIPYGLLEEYEFGYANREILETSAAGRFRINNSFIFGFYASDAFFDIWSKHSERNLLLWHQKINKANLGFGSKFTPPSENYIVVTEFTIEKATLDSMKYIDNRFVKISGYAYSLKLGFEYKISKSFIFRAGFNFKLYEKDIWTGLNKVNYYKIASGTEINSRYFLIVNFGKYRSTQSPLNYKTKSTRETLSISLAIKLI